jgi:hypothetical protein
MSSLGQRSHGENFVRLLDHLAVGSTHDVADIPCIANGLCRDSSDARLNELSLKGELEWRTVDASGGRSPVYRVKYFYTPEAAKEVAPPAAVKSSETSVVEELRSLASMRDGGILTGAQFEAAKERLLRK